MIKTFRYAFEGIGWSIRNHRTFRIYVAVAAAVLLLGFSLQISREEFIILLFTIGFCFMAEMMNTAIEELTNLITIKWAHQAKVAKDVAAGMSLVAAITASIVGIVIFVPYLAAYL